MRKIMKKSLVLGLSLALTVMSLTGCGKDKGGDKGNDTQTSGTTSQGETNAPDTTAEQKKDENTGDAGVEEIVGNYAVDLTDLGMPLQFYIMVKEDGTFQLTNALEGGADKGNGKVGKSGDTYMFVYSDSTADASKTATFTLNGKNLEFSSALPYGTSNIQEGAVAKGLVFEEYLGDYAGKFEKTVEAMKSTFEYDFSLTLNYGAEYKFVSSFDAMGEPQYFEETGTFDIADGKLTLTPEGGESVEGTIAADGRITAAMKLSAMGSSRDAVELEKATTSEYSGTYTGLKDMSQMGMMVNTVLKLDKLGGYKYTAKMEGEEDFVEEGSYAVDGEKITFTASEEGAQAVEGTLVNKVLTAKFKISAQVPMSTEIVFYDSSIQGTFTAEDAEGAEGLASELVLNSDGTYTIAVTKDGAEVYKEAGTFATEASMAGINLITTSDSGTSAAGLVSSDGINLTHAVDDAGTTAGFSYVRGAAESMGMGE